MENRPLAITKGFLDHRGIEIIGKPLFSIDQFELLKQRKGSKIMSLADKLNASKNTGNGSLASKLSSSGNGSLASKLSSNQSFNNKTDINLNKIVEVEMLRNDLKDQGLLIAAMVDKIDELIKVAFENNSILAIIGKDQKSTLNAINSIGGKFATSGKPSTTGNEQAPPAILRKGNGMPPATTGLLSQGLSDDNYQAIYEIFKGHFNNKFAKDSRPVQLNEFKYFGNGINFYSLQGIHDTCRTVWQSFRTENNSMLFAPGSMILAITSAIKTGIELDLIKDFSPIISAKSKPDELVKIAMINNEFADENLAINTTTGNEQAPTIVRDFAYWSAALGVSLDIIKECISVLDTDDISLDMTQGIIKDHIKGNSNASKAFELPIDEFIDYLANTNFAKSN